MKKGDSRVFLVPELIDDDSLWLAEGATRSSDSPITVNDFSVFANFDLLDRPCKSFYSVVLPSKGDTAELYPITFPSGDPDFARYNFEVTKCSEGYVVHLNDHINDLRLVKVGGGNWPKESSKFHKIAALCRIYGNPPYTMAVFESDIYEDLVAKTCNGLPPEVRLQGIMDTIEKAASFFKIQIPETKGLCFGDIHDELEDQKILQSMHRRIPSTSPFNTPILALTEGYTIAQLKISRQPERANEITASYVDYFSRPFSVNRSAVFPSDPVIQMEKDEVDVRALRDRISKLEDRISQLDQESKEVVENAQDVAKKLRSTMEILDRLSEAQQTLAETARRVQMKETSDKGMQRSMIMFVVLIIAFILTRLMLTKRS